MAKRILVVDDSPLVAAVIGHALRQAGFAVDVARDLSDLEREPPTRADLVLMDVVLHEAYGDDVAALLRATGQITGRVLLLSSLPDAELEARAADAGLDGFVPKRLGVAAIVERVRALLGEMRSPPPRVAPEGFALETRLRLRRVRYMIDRTARWNTTAVVVEMLALAGDADLAGAPAIAAAARACADAARAAGAAGPSRELRGALAALDRAADVPARSPERRAIVLVVDAGELGRRRVVPHLDRGEHVVFEARTAAEARQKLRVADYDLVVVEAGAAASGLVAEIAADQPALRVVVADPGSDPEALVAELDRSLAQSLQLSRKG